MNYNKDFLSGLSQFFSDNNFELSSVENIPFSVFESDNGKYIINLAAECYNAKESLNFNNMVLPIPGDVEYLLDLFELQWMKHEKKAQLKQNILLYMENMPDGCLTTIKGVDGEYITVDSKRLDLDNFKSAIYIMELNNQTEVVIKSKDNRYHTVSLEELKIIVADIISLGLNLYSYKWNVERIITDCLTMDELLNIDIKYMVA